MLHRCRPAPSPTEPTGARVEVEDLLLRSDMEFNPDVGFSERSGHALAGLLRRLAGGSSDRIGITVSCPVHQVQKLKPYYCAEAETLLLLYISNQMDADATVLEQNSV